MRGDLSYFSEWEQIITKTFEFIKSEDALLRLICNNEPDPYASVAPSWKDIIMNNIFPMPKDPDSVGKEKTFVNIYIGKTNIYDENPYYHENYMYIDVGCHLNLWPLSNGGFRPYRICSLIDKMMDNKSIGSISIQKVIPVDVKVIRFGDMYFGYRLIYKLSNTGGMSCG